MQNIGSVRTLELASLILTCMTGTGKVIHSFFRPVGAEQWQQISKTNEGLYLAVKRKIKPTKQRANASTHGLTGNETGSQEESVPTRQMMLRWKTVSNRIVRLLQTCQLECELHVWYENQEKFSQAGRLHAKDFTTCSLQGHSPTATLAFHSGSTCN